MFGQREALLTLLVIKMQGSERRWVQGNPTAPVELPLAHEQQSLLEIHLRHFQVQRLGNPQTGAGQEPNQRLIRVRPQLTRQLACGHRELSDLFGTVEKRLIGLLRRTKEMPRWKLR